MGKKTKRPARASAKAEQKMMFDLTKQMLGETRPPVLSILKMLGSRQDLSFGAVDSKEMSNYYDDLFSGQVEPIIRNSNIHMGYVSFIWKFLKQPIDAIRNLPESDMEEMAEIKREVMPAVLEIFTGLSLREDLLFGEATEQALKSYYESFSKKELKPILRRHGLSWAHMAFIAKFLQQIFDGMSLRADWSIGHLREVVADYAQDKAFGKTVSEMSVQEAIAAKDEMAEKKK